MDAMRHEPFVGRRLHEESIRLQQGLAETPLPLEEEERDHPLLRAMAAVLAAMVLIALALVLLPPGASA